MFIAPNLDLHAAHVAVHMGVQLKDGRRPVAGAIVCLDPAVFAHGIGKARPRRKFPAKAVVMVIAKGRDKEQYIRQVPFVLYVEGIAFSHRPSHMAWSCLDRFLLSASRPLCQGACRPFVCGTSPP